MVTLNKKKEIVAVLVEKFRNASSFYLIDFKGMTVENSIHFRRELKKQDIQYQVAKNTLIKRALTELGKAEIVPDDKFFGPTGVIFCSNNPVAPAKIIKEVSEKTEIPKLKAAVLEGQFYDGSQLKLIASLPTKPDIIAGILGSLDAPISGIVGSINAVLRDVAYLVEEVAKKKAS